MGLQKSQTRLSNSNNNSASHPSQSPGRHPPHTHFLFNIFDLRFLLLFLPMLSSALWSLFHGLLTLDSDSSSCFQLRPIQYVVDRVSSLNVTSEFVTLLIKILTQLSMAYRITFKLLHMAHMIWPSPISLAL